MRTLAVGHPGDLDVRRAAAAIDEGRAFACATGERLWSPPPDRQGETHLAPADQDSGAQLKRSTVRAWAWFFGAALAQIASISCIRPTARVLSSTRCSTEPGLSPGAARSLGAMGVA